MKPVVDVRGLHFVYPDGREALTGVDLTIAAGERVALLGPNGAGKTTLALHLNGIHRAVAGSISVTGIELADDTLAEIRRRVGLVFQDSDDQLFMPTVAEDVAFGPANAGLSGQALSRRVDESLELAGALELGPRVPHHLSGGEKRSASIATALAMRPDVLVLDEPTSGLDPAGRGELAATLSELDVTLVVITHDLPFALEVCERSLIMDEGRVVADGPTHSLLADGALLERHRLSLPFGFQLQGG